MEYIRSVSPGYLWKNKGYGDWYAMGETTPVDLIDQCFYAHSTEILMKAASVLGKDDDAETYSVLLDSVKAAYRREYARVETQTALVLALAFDLVKEEERGRTAKMLAERIGANGNKLATGFLGTPYLLKALSDNGYTELAYGLLLSTACPSWLYPLTKGATTIWERWDAVRPDNSLQPTSFNHYAYGAVGQWLYEHVAGVQKAAPGYSKIVIRPLMGGGLTWAEGSYASALGTIRSRWEIKHDKVQLWVTIPEGATADIYLPISGEKKSVAGGRYHYSVPLRWTVEKSNSWWNKQPWLVGENFQPSWGDTAAMRKALKDVASRGMNTVRVKLAGEEQQVDEYLKLATTYKLRTIFVIGDSCIDVVKAFRKDTRILLWDAGNNSDAYAWMRELHARQPVTGSDARQADIISYTGEALPVSMDRPAICMNIQQPLMMLPMLKANGVGGVMATKQHYKTDAQYFLKAITDKEADDSGVVSTFSTLHDGPYVVHVSEGVQVQSIRNGVVQSKLLGAREGAVVQVQFEGHEDWNFDVPLKKQLVNEPCVFVQPEKLFVLSDIEGEFAAFRALLIAGGVIDEQSHWIFGRGHVVVCGDLFDRGRAVPETLWLLYKLEEEAKQAGGYVHTILGNHDIMNLSGDLRYVQPKYFVSADLLGCDYQSLYDGRTELGRWLRTKNTIEKIGENLCLHGGVAPAINASVLTLDEMNARCRPYYDNVKVLHGVNDPLLDAFFTGSTSLFWYRGYFTHPHAYSKTVTETLTKFDVKRILVGHTIEPGNIQFRYNGKVLALDVDQHKGDHQAAVFESGTWYSVNDKGVRRRL